MLESTDLRLVPVDPEQISEEYIGWFNDPETFRFLGSKFGQTRSTVRQYVESVRPPNLLCKIIVKRSEQHIGNIGLHTFDPIHRRMELGIVIGAAAARGQGFGAQACSRLIQHGFDHLNLHKVTAGTVEGNEAMKKVFLRLGFRVEGTLTEHYFLEGRYRSMYRFGLLRDWFKPAS